MVKSVYVCECVCVLYTLLVIAVLWETPLTIAAFKSLSLTTDIVDAESGAQL